MPASLGNSNPINPSETHDPEGRSKSKNLPTFSAVVMNSIYLKIPGDQDMYEYWPLILKVLAFCLNRSSHNRRRCKVSPKVCVEVHFIN
jgi:hypothetical protein